MLIGEPFRGKARRKKRGPTAPKSKMTRQILAYACLFAGVIGLLVPVLPGVPVVILGISLLGQDHWLRKRAASLVNSFRKAQ